jgi:hypothetical protein
MVYRREQAIKDLNLSLVGKSDFPLRLTLTKEQSAEIEAATKMSHKETIDAFVSGDAEGTLLFVENTFSLQFVRQNHLALMKRGIFEETLAIAWTETRVNHSAWSLNDTATFFRLCDREKLLAAGDPLPSGAKFTLYRGVAGKGRSRKIRGMSWTSSIEKAVWFANRYPQLEDPAVYQTTVHRDEILFYYNGREEEEFVCLASRCRRTRRYDVLNAC